MRTCPKCYKQSPEKAAFCGYCGADMAAPGEVADHKKTVFGYRADASMFAPKSGAPAAEDPPTIPIAPPQMEQAAPAAAAAPAAPASSGMVADRFTLQGEAWSMPVGDLFVARDAQDRAEVDLLLLHAAVFPSPLDLERSRRELRQLQKVECPQIATIIDHGRHDGQLYIATERLGGTTLAAQLGRGPLPFEDAKRIIQDVGTALAEAQKVGVIHRDISPENVVLGADGSVKLRGFGAAPPLSRHVFGTPEYISPEQASGRPVDQRSNIYSLGALLYHMLTGAPPFSGTPEVLMEKHRKEDPPPLPAELRLPPRSEQLIAKALSKSSSRRHLTLRQFLRDVEALSVGGSVQAPAPRQPVSFETPLHGVTALTGGDRPPSSEVPSVGPGKQVMVAGDSRLDGNAATMFAMASAPTAPGTAAPEGIEHDRTNEVPAFTPPPASAGEPVPLTPTRPPALTVTPDSGAAVGGEMAQGERVSLRQSSEVEPLQTQEQAPGATAAPPPGGQQAGPTDPNAPRQGGFRETMWFFKGEVESAMAEQGADDVPRPAENLADLADKYADDGSLTEDGQKLSLRTGNTQAMKAVKIPDGHLPGKKMDAEDFVAEMNKGKRTAMLIGLIVVGGAILVGAVVLLAKLFG